MKNKWVINQDRDEIILVTRSTQIEIKKVELRGNIIGFNLLTMGKLLGTFDTLGETILELVSIRLNPKEFHVISGYSPFN